MSEEEIRAEMEQLRERLHQLHATLEGPMVQPVLHYGNGTSEPAWCNTLAEAFAENEDDSGDYWRPIVGVSVGGCLVTSEKWETDPRNPDAAAEIQRRAEKAAEDARKAAEKAARAEQLEQWRRETEVALFHNNLQVTAWVPFIDGKAPVPDEWLAGGKNRASTLHTLQMRMKNGNGISAARPSVQEHVVKTYSMTWRTVW